MANITSAGTGNSNAGATWTGGSVPTSSDNAIIQNGHTVTQNAAHTFKSLKVETGGTWTADGSNHLTLSGENDNDFAFRILGTYNHANGTVVINNGGGGIAHAAIQAGDATSTTGLYDLTISGGGTTCEIFGDTTIHRNMEAGGATTVLRGALTVNGNLTVYGALTTIFSSTSHNLTVNGTTTIGLGSGAADVSTLTCNASTVSLGSGITSSAYGLYVNQGGTFTGGSGTHTLGSVVVRNNAAAKCTLTSGVTTINGEHGGENYAINIEGSDSVFAHGSGTVTITRASDTRIRNAGADLALNNLIINHASADITLASNGLTCAGNLTITAGEFGTGVDKALTVTGDVDITGTLTGNASAISMGSLTINSGGTYSATSGTTTITSKASSNFAFKNEGTFTHNNGTMQIGDGSTSTGGAHIMNTTYHNLIINRDQNAPDGNTPWRPSSGSEVTIAGNLTVTKGRFYRNNSSNSLVVTGDVDIAANGQVGTEAANGSNTFGGIRINSGGKYLATSGTTTVTNRFTGTSNVWKNDGGTFTHNNGTVKFTDNDHSKVKEQGSFYNFEQASSLGDYALLWETAGGGSCTILNNLTITRGDFEIDAAGDTLDIHGQTILNGSSDTGARFNNDKNQTGTITHHGIVTINGGTYHVEDGATVNMAGIRNLGGVVD